MLEVRHVLASAAVALAVASSATPAHAATDSCTLGSPNIVRDVTDCVYSVIGNCPIGGSPNIVRDVMECLS